MKKLITLLAILGLTNVAFAAIPTISNVTGTVNTGQTLTVTGANMVQEVTTNWYPNWSNHQGDFEGSSPSANGFLAMTGESGVYDTTVKLMGNQSIKFHAAGVSDGSTYSQQMYSYNYTNETNQSNYWVRGYVRYNAANKLWVWGHIKMWDLQGSSPPNDYVQWTPSTTLPNSMRLTLDSTATNYDANIPNPPLQNNRWYLIEVHVQPTLITVYVDNQQIISQSKQSTSLAYFNFGLVNLNGTSSGFSLDHWMDGLTISSSRVYAASTIVISNNATYGMGTQIYQEPIYLSDSSIQFKADLTGLGTGPYYLFVTNNGQTTSSAYNLSGGAGGGAVPVNGACGPANGQSFASLTSASANLCSSGTVASFTGSGPWTWGCNGSSGGTNTASTACSASLTSVVGTTGSISGTSTSGTLLFSESFENNSYASRGWYDNSNQGTIVSGGQSGNCLQWAWAKGATTPTNGGSMRMKFTPTDSLYLSYYVKFQSGWQGSQQTYHPHMMYILSNLDDAANAYSPLANNYLNTYVEFLSDIGSPYAIRPQLAIQDEMRVNTSNGTPPNNLTAVSENRSVAYCNTPVSSGAAGTCYADNPYYSANTWKASTASVSTNSWHRVEVYFKMNSISGGIGQHDGIMQEWIDGVQVINHSDVLYRTNQDATKKWAQFVLAPYIGTGSPIAQTMWIDELTIGTGRTSIVAPSGLTIKSVTP